MLDLWRNARVRVAVSQLEVPTFGTELMIKMIHVGAALIIPQKSCEAWAQPLHVFKILAGNEMRYEMKCPVRLAAPPP